MPYELYCPETGSHVYLSHEDVCRIANGGGVSDYGAPGLVVRVNPQDLPLAAGGAETVNLPLTVQQSIGDHGIIANHNNLVLAPLSVYDVVLNTIGTNDTDAPMSGSLIVRLYVDGGNGGIGGMTYWQQAGPVSNTQAARYRGSSQNNYVRVSAAAEALTIKAVPASGSATILNLAQLIITLRARVPA